MKFFLEQIELCSYVWPLRKLFLTIKLLQSVLLEMTSHIGKLLHNRIDKHCQASCSMFPFLHFFTRPIATWECVSRTKKKICNCGRTTPCRNVNFPGLFSTLSFILNPFSMSTSPLFMSIKFKDLVFLFTFYLIFCMCLGVCVLSFVSLLILPSVLLALRITCTLRQSWAGNFTSLVVR